MNTVNMDLTANLHEIPEPTVADRTLIQSVAKCHVIGQANLIEYNDGVLFRLTYTVSAKNYNDLRFGLDRLPRAIISLIATDYRQAIARREENKPAKLENLVSDHHIDEEPAIRINVHAPTKVNMNIHQKPVDAQSSPPPLPSRRSAIASALTD